MRDLVREGRELLRREHVLRNAAVLAGGTGLAHVIALVVLPLLTRLYSPTDFGVLAAYASILSILSIVAALRYELAIVVPRRLDEAISLLTVSLLAVGLVTGLVGVPSLLLPDELGRLLRVPQLASHLWLIPPALCGAGALAALSNWAIRRRHFGDISRSKIIQGSSQATAQILTGLAGWAPAGLLAGDAVGRILAALFLGGRTWRRDQRVFHEHRGSTIRNALRRFKWFPLLTGPSSLLNISVLQLPLFIMVAAYGTEVGGLFSLAVKTVAAPTALIGMAVTKVYFGESAKLGATDPVALEALFRRTARQLFAIAVPPILAIVLLAPWLFRVAFGAQWIVAAQYVQILGTMLLAQFTVIPLSQTLIALERQGWQFSWDLARFLIVIGGMLLTINLGHGPTTAVAVFGGTMTASYVVLLALCDRAIAVRVEAVEAS